MKQTQNSGNSACKFSISPGFARLKNLLSTKRARTITAMFAFFASLLSLCFLQNPSFASLLRTPATYLNISTSTPNVDFQFNQSELSSSAFKTNNVTVNIQTDNATGATTYISSVDEATSLVHSDSGVSDSIASISSPLLSSAFSGKTWGYRVGSLATTAFNPIPKASVPAEILNTTSATPASNNLNIDFGVKVSPDLSSGTYSKQILFTTTTNYVPTFTKFLPGPAFNAILHALDPGALSTEYFKHSATPPANLADATIVSTADSEKTIYAWLDNANSTIYWWTEADTVYANEDASYMFAGEMSGHSFSHLDLRDINMSKVKNMSYMFRGGKGFLEELNLGSFDTSNVEDMSYMFTYFNPEPGSAVTNIDLTKLNTSKVKNMKGMFNNTQWVTTLDASVMDTSNVEDMEEMFKYSSIKTLNMTGLDVSKVTTMKNMFENSAITSLDLSNFNTISLTNTSGMFSCAKKLANLNLSNFKTDNVTDMSKMFNMRDLYSYVYVEPQLTQLDLSSFNTSNVLDMREMFAGMSNLPSLNVSNFNTSNVQHMYGMFYGTSKLMSLDLTSFDTRNVIDMGSMFSFSMTAPGATTLDLSSFNTQNVTSAGNMFSDAKMTRIYASNNFTTLNIPASNNLFNGNTNLVGGNGTTFSLSNPRDKTYARIDAPGTPGYFTLKP